MPTRQVNSNLQYVTATDGAHVAFTTVGDGPPLVVPAMGPLHTLQVERRIKSWRDWYGELARTSKVVRYEGRGTGLSSGPVDFGLSARLADLEAVVDVLDLPVFDLMAIRASGPAAIAYAVQHPERVGHLILWCTYDRGTEYYGAPEARDTMAGIEEDWAGYTETVVRERLMATGALAEHITAMLKSTFAREIQRQFVTQGLATDVSAILNQVRAPTLVVHRLQLRFPSIDVARRISAQIPDARLVLLDGNLSAPFIGEGDSVEIVNRFLDRPTESFVAPVVAPPTVSPADLLSYREWDVLRLMADAQSNQEIADTLLISLHTVKSHVSAIMSKLNVSRRTAAIVTIRELSLID